MVEWFKFFNHCLCSSIAWLNEYTLPAIGFPSVSPTRVSPMNFEFWLVMSNIFDPTDEFCTKCFSGTNFLYETQRNWLNKKGRRKLLINVDSRVVGRYKTCTISGPPLKLRTSGPLPLYTNKHPLNNNIKPNTFAQVFSNIHRT